jgi:hypothetical protein
LMVVTTLPVTPAHTFVLTVSHGLLFRQPPFCATATTPPLRFTEFCSKVIASASSRPRSPL